MGDFDLHVFIPLCYTYVTDNFNLLLGYFDLCMDLLNVNKNSDSNEHCQHHHHHYPSFLHVVALLSHLQEAFVCVMEGFGICLLT